MSLFESIFNKHDKPKATSSLFSASSSFFSLAAPAAEAVVAAVAPHRDLEKPSGKEKSVKKQKKVEGTQQPAEGEGKTSAAGPELPKSLSSRKRKADGEDCHPDDRLHGEGSRKKPEGEKKKKKLAESSLQGTDVKIPMHETLTSTVNPPKPEASMKMFGVQGKKLSGLQQVRQGNRSALEAGKNESEEVGEKKKKKKNAKAEEEDPGEEAEAHHDEVETETAEASKKLTPEEEAEKLRRTVFVGNVPVSNKTKTKLTEIFIRHGDVQSVRLRSLPLDMSAKGDRRAKVLQGRVDPERTTCNAYVVFASADSVSGALSANMTEMEGQHIRVDRATTAKAKGGAGMQYDPSRSIFVGNLHFQTKDEELHRLFGNAEVAPELSDCIEAVRVIRDQATNIGKGFAFVLFKTKAAARAALENGPWMLRKRTLRVTKVAPVKSLPKALGSTFKTALYKERVTAHEAAQKGGRGASAAERPGGGSVVTSTSGEEAPKSALRNKKAASSSSGALAVVDGVKKRTFDVGGSKTSDWQGLRTKGKERGIRGPKALARPSGSAAGGSGKASAAPSNRKRDGKRPSVAARKKGGSGGPSGSASKGSKHKADHQASGKKRFAKRAVSGGRPRKS